jgi:hypothetical protein
MFLAATARVVKVQERIAPRRLYEIVRFAGLAGDKANALA